MHYKHTTITRAETSASLKLPMIIISFSYFIQTLNGKEDNCNFIPHPTNGRTSVTSLNESSQPLTQQMDTSVQV